MQTFDLVPLSHTHAHQAANLVARRYRRLRASVPALPPDHQCPESYRDNIRKLISDGPGVAALVDGQLVGFLIGRRIPGQRVHVPEWANAVDDDLEAPIYGEGKGAFTRSWTDRKVLSTSCGIRKLVYRRMYEALSVKWVAAGRFTHLVTHMAHDHEGLDAWLWSGFGPLVTDAVRGLSGVQGEMCSGITIKRATPEDVAAITVLVEAHERYMAGPPLFMPLTEMSSAENQREWLPRRGNVYFLAYRNGEPVAYMKRQPSEHGAAYIASGPNSTAVTGAYTIESARGSGVATSLLAAIVDSARADGCGGISVDFECFNILGSRFWLRHFTPVCYSFVRKIDERIAWAGADRARESVW